MTSVSPDDVRELAEKIRAIAVEATDRKNTQESLAGRIEALVAGAQTELPLTAAGNFDDARWVLLPLSEQLQRHAQLLRYYDALLVLAGSDGPTDSSSIMFRDYVSNRGVIVLTVFALLGTITMLAMIHAFWPNATERITPGSAAAAQMPPAAVPPGTQTVLPGPREQDVLLMVMLMGSMGGFVHLTGSLAKYIGNRQLLRSWIIYYFLMPAEGAGLAVTVYLMVRVGVLNPASSNGDATRNLNWVGIYALSILSGLFSKQALEMLSDLFNSVFRRVRAKDAGGTGNPSDDSSARER